MPVPMNSVSHKSTLPVPKLLCQPQIHSACLSDTLSATNPQCLSQCHFVGHKCHSDLWAKSIFSSNNSPTNVSLYFTGLITDCLQLCDNKGVWQTLSIFLSALVVLNARSSSSKYWLSFGVSKTGSKSTPLISKHRSFKCAKLSRSSEEANSCSASQVISHTSEELYLHYGAHYSPPITFVLSHQV